MKKESKKIKKPEEVKVDETPEGVIGRIYSYLKLGDVSMAMFLCEKFKQ